MEIKERTTRMNIVVQRLDSKKQHKFSWTASCQDVSTNVVPSQEPVAPGVDAAIRICAILRIAGVDGFSLSVLPFGLEMNDRPTYKDFSKTLFWDVDPLEVDFDRNRRWFVVRVLEYGRIEDWKSLLKLYSLEEIVRAAQSARTIEPKAFSFLCFVSGSPKESFRCFTMKP